MSDENQRLKSRIRELEQELNAKGAELQLYKSQLGLANQQLEKVISQMGQELKMASQLQKHLNPTEIPPISGFDFSTKFVSGFKTGGDYFDIFELQDRMKFAILVSSASGYNLSALFLSVLIKISTSSEAKKSSDAHQTVKSLIDELQPQMGLDDRISLFYGVIDKRNYDLSYCHLGTQQAYLQVMGQESLESLEPCAGVITKNSTPQLNSVKVSLNPRDRIVICTDGVLRAQDPQGHPWGGENLRDAIRQAPRSGVHELRNEILFRLEKFTGGTDPERDQTVIVSEVKDRVIKLAKG
jgi:sigma-B regulation protein RsbU (phosphoserine phosphatase)